MMKTIAGVSMLVASAAALGHHPELYRKVKRADGDAKHSVTFWVKLADGALEDCDSLLKQISDPTHEKWSQHLSHEDMKRFANVEAFKTTMSYLAQRFEPSQLQAARQMEFVRVTATVAEFEAAFGTALYEYELLESAKVRAFRAIDFSLPAELRAHVDFTDGLESLPHRTAGQRALVAGGGSRKRQYTVNTTPEVIFKTYGVDKHDVQSSTTSGIFAAGQYFVESDAKQYWQTYNIDTPSTFNTDGNNQPSDCTNANSCIEASLDVQQITTSAQGANVTFYEVPDNIQDVFAYWVGSLADDPAPPHVNSVSYGSIGPETPTNDMQRFDTEMCKLNARGVTVFVSSGDDGVANFVARNNATACGFNPSYPATSQYVTAVGATHGPEVGSEEVACSSKNGGCIITTGGGFSDYYPQPSYQASAVSSYLSNAPNLPPSGQFNEQGRGYPDVSFLGHSFPTIVEGSEVGPVDGTSASSPAFASLIVLVNDARVSAGKNPIGFLNPIFYQQLADGFNDITKGENNCAAGESSPICCQYGFSATEGWDPLTGLGSPKFDKIYNYLTNLS